MAISSPIISTESLYSLLNDKNLIILDASMPPVGGIKPPIYSWPNNVISHARRFDIDNEFSEIGAPFPHTMLSQASFTQKLQDLGINQDSIVIVYDDLGIYSAARAWYMCHAAGIKRVAILDGGLPQWINEKRPVNAAEVKLVTKGNVITQITSTAFCTTSEVNYSRENRTAVILDARSAGRFAGREKEPRPGLRCGHIPGAKNIPFTELLINGQFKPVHELKHIFAKYAHEDQHLIMTCGSGVTACVLACGAMLAGYKRISVYDGSWAEWGASKVLPISTC